ncbi:CrcB family protein [Microbacterium sp. 4R-513]|uniref:fluoride efflux transporter FluC n=1 Tax=Microbacterium sp. 4R-513 TaxID=2567934 RepID=UPI0013E10EA4|nr:CrcB family protein [Microbacterium sp. 4R-513]QIG38845.1 CrcB family protein [Microbacterium sp. 4R-513]
MARTRAFTPAAFVAVVAGGAIGVALRALFVVPLGSVDDAVLVPAVTLVINLVGSFLLGLVVGWLDDRRPLTRAFFGTGLLGGFTTYSAFAVQVVELGGTAPVLSLVIAAVSLFGGVLFAALGLRVGHAVVGAGDRVEPPEVAE